MSWCASPQDRTVQLERATEASEAMRAAAVREENALTVRKYCVAAKVRFGVVKRPSARGGKRCKSFDQNGVHRVRVLVDS